ECNFEQTITLREVQSRAPGAPHPVRDFSLAIGLNLRRAFAFFDPVEAIDAGQIHALDGPAGPMNLRTIDLCAAPQPEMHAKIIRRRVTASADDVAALP